MGVRRYDNGELKSPEKLPNGWLRADAFFTRTGVFVYRNPDGSARRELRLPEEVFKKDALDSFAVVPFTDDHPPVMLTASNTKEFVRGAIEAPRRDGEHVRGTILVYDGETIAKMDAGKRQLSCGYSCDLEEKPGEWNGLRYDAIQRNIRGNHVALVDRGRAGPGAAVKMDAADAFMVDAANEDKPGERPEKDTAMKRKIKVDGISFEVEEAHADAFEKFERETKARIDALTAEITATKRTAETEKARADVASENAAKAEKARTDATDPKRLDALVEARASLLSLGREHVSADFKLDGKSDRDVKVAILAKLGAGFKADGRTDDYVNARFDLAIESAAKASNALAGANAAAHGRKDNADAKDNGTPKTEKERRDAMVARERDRWMKPTTGAFNETAAE